MVSYFVPRGRFLIKAGNLRQAHQQQTHHKQFQQQQKQSVSVKWPMLQQFRQTFSNKGNTAPTVNKNVHNSIESTVPNQNKNCTSNENLVELKRLQQKQQSKKQHNAFVRWTSFLLKFAPVGFCVFGAIEWQMHKRKCERENIPRRATAFQARIYCWLPLRLISRCWGWIAACHVPTSLRPFVYGLYSNTFNVNIDEAEDNDYKHYESLSQFFTRPLRDGVRPIDKRAALVSPADGKVLHFGSASNALIEQVKGVDYSIESFLGPADWQKEKQSSDYEATIKQNKDNCLYQCVIYLAPGDYHRFHSPAQWQPKLRRHFSGELLSVNPRVAHWLPGLFCLNERALYVGNWQHGFFSYTAVGATNVGSVEIYIDEKLRTNKWMGLQVGAHKQRESYDELQLPASARFDKGQLVGQFNMGSTIVLLFEAPKNFKFNIEAGQKLRVGEPIGYIGEKNELHRNQPTN